MCDDVGCGLLMGMTLFERWIGEPTKHNSASCKSVDRGLGHWLRVDDVCACGVWGMRRVCGWVGARTGGCRVFLYSSI